MQWPGREKGKDTERVGAEGKGGGFLGKTGWAPGRKAGNAGWSSWTPSHRAEVSGPGPAPSQAPPSPAPGFAWPGS